ncbi:MAG: tetratricopeptide repeat protein [Thermodesulfobacteriota bacterium]
MRFSIEKTASPLSIGIGLIVLIVAVYGRVYRLDFVHYDDTEYVWRNAIVLKGLSLEGIRWALVTGHASNWHPLTWISHMVDVSLFGAHPSGHHLMNVLFHALNSVLLFLFWTRVTGNRWSAAALAGLFALHPLHVESVAWISERKDVLSTWFLLLTLFSWNRFVRHQSLRNYLISLVCFSLGLMAKPMVVTLPCLLLLLDFWPYERHRHPNAVTLVDSAQPNGLLRRFFWLFVEKVPFFLLSAVSSLMTIVVQRKAMGSLEALPLDVRLANAITAYVRYIGKLLWPNDLAVFYPYSESVHGWRVAACLAVLLLISALLWWKRRAHPYGIVGWLWFLGTLVPVIGLVQVGGQSMANRYTYIPSIGFFLVLCWWFADRLRHRPAWVRPIAFGYALVLGWMGGLTFVQIGYWQNTLTLFRHAESVTGPNHVAQINLGVFVAERDGPEAALPYFLRAIQIKPNDVEARFNAGLAYRQIGRYAEAVQQYRMAVTLNSGYVEAWNNLGVVLDLTGDRDAARAAFERALSIDPDYEAAQINLNKLERKSQ